MKPAPNQQALESFYVDELLRFYKSQEHHGKAYLEATKRIWTLNAKQGPYYKAYREVIRRLECPKT